MMDNNIPNKIPEVHEFLLGGEDLNNLPMTARNVEYKNVVFSYKATNLSAMRDIAKETGQMYTGMKKVLWD